MMPCASCGRPLTDDRSVRRGLGPVCAARHVDATRAALVASLAEVGRIVTTAPVAVLAMVRASLADLEHCLVGVR